MAIQVPNLVAPVAQPSQPGGLDLGMLLKAFQQLNQRQQPQAGPIAPAGAPPIAGVAPTQMQTQAQQPLTAISPAVVNSPQMDMSPAFQQMLHGILGSIQQQTPRMPGLEGSAPMTPTPALGQNSPSGLQNIASIASMAAGGK